MMCPFVSNKRNRRLVAVWNYLHTQGDTTSAEMAVDMGVSQHTVASSIMAARRASPGVFRIAGWHRYVHEVTNAPGGGRMAPVWSIMPGRDAPEPKGVSPAKSARACYDRKRAATLVKRRVNGVNTVDTFQWLVRNQLGK